MTATRTYRTLPERTVPPGALDRGVLASAVGFALGSLRAGLVDRRDGEELPWFDDEGLAWHQEDWIASGEDIKLARMEWRDELYPEAAEVAKGFDPTCGTGCCIAGWIELHSPEVRRHHDTGTRDRALRMLLGYTFEDLYGEVLLSGLPEGALPDWLLLHCSDGLFAGSNDLSAVFRHADALLALYGMEPLVVEADGTVR